MLAVYTAESAIKKERAIPEFDIEKCTLCHKCIEVCEQNTLAHFSEVKTRARLTP